jgi:hypothetical protein
MGHIFHGELHVGVDSGRFLTPFIQTLASLASQRSNCMKRRVGAILVRCKQLISAGGQPKLTDFRQQNPCHRVSTICRSQRNRGVNNRTILYRYNGTPRGLTNCNEGRHSLAYSIAVCLAWLIFAKVAAHGVMVKPRVEKPWMSACAFTQKKMRCSKRAENELEMEQYYTVIRMS